jgi:phosphoribosylglycinamide formyltransferase-1
MKSIVILISGRGSNMEAIVKANLPLKIAAVISNRPDAKGLAFATARGVATNVVDHKQFPSRDAFDLALAESIEQWRPDYVVLAGFMRVLTDGFVARYPKRIINIHPSLLPAFPGLHTHRQAIAAGVKLHGATVHFVTPQLDHGPIIVQAAVPVLIGDSEDTLAARVLVQEHRIYPMALEWLAEGRLDFMTGDVVQLRRAGVDSDNDSGNAGAAFCHPNET